MICSFIPGRIRLRSPLFTDEKSVAMVMDLLKNQPGLQNIENNLNTGSLLIFYDPDKLDQEAVLAALELLETAEKTEPLRPNEASCPLPSIRLNKEAVEYISMIGAFAICLSSTFLRSKGLHVYSGLALAGLTVQHLIKYRKRLLFILKSSQGIKIPLADSPESQAKISLSL